MMKKDMSQRQKNKIMKVINDKMDCLEKCYRNCWKKLTNKKYDEYEYMVMHIIWDDKEDQNTVYFTRETSREICDGSAIRRALSRCNGFYADACDYEEQCAEYYGLAEDEEPTYEQFSDFMQMFLKTFPYSDNDDFDPGFTDDMALVLYVYNKTKNKFVYQNNTKFFQF